MNDPVAHVWFDEKDICGDRCPRNGQLLGKRCVRCRMFVGTITRRGVWVMPDNWESASARCIVNDDRPSISTTLSRASMKPTRAEVATKAIDLFEAIETLGSLDKPARQITAQEMAEYSFNMKLFGDVYSELIKIRFDLERCLQP